MLRPAHCSIVDEIPETRFADTAVGRIAYQIVGGGSPNLLVVLPLLFPIDLMWDEPTLARFLERLAAFSCSIWFDSRGRGASDPLPHADERLAETLVDDMLALLDCLGLSDVAVLGIAAPTAILFATSHPERTAALALWNTRPRFLRADDYPDSTSAGRLEELQSRFFEAWGTGGHLGFVAPSLAHDARLRRWLGRCERLLCTAGEASWRVHAALQTDVRPALAAVQVPTLVMWRRGFVFAEQCRYVADHIRGARSVELPGEGGDLDHNLFFTGDTGPMLDAIEEFLTGQLPAHRSDRVLATVLFTDIVGSTEHAARMGDRRWRELLATHDALLGAEVERFRGRMVKSTGDGLLATFDGPGRSIRCACAIRDAVRALGIDIRAGLHTGEVELRGDDVAGMAVHIGARVSALAGAGEVLVSSTVKDLVAGSGIEFEDRGEHELRGVPGSWKLYAVAG
jgi:class 3 adenylate cyclase